MKPIRTILMLLAILVAGSVFAQSTSQQGTSNWSVAVRKTDSGHLLGNPDAATKLVEYMSYTCSHCAHFSRTGARVLKLAYIPTGKVSLEIRHLLRDPVDLTAAMLANCGTPLQFKKIHTAILLKQDEWLAKARETTQAQRARWNFGTGSARRRAIASDLDFYEIMESHGFSRVQIDRCLANEDLAKSLAERSAADTGKYGLTGTPSFLMNGKLLDDVYSWEKLRPLIPYNPAGLPDAPLG